MKFFMMTNADEATDLRQPPSLELIEEMTAFVEESLRNGTVVATGSMDVHATRITHKAGQFTITDGPYTEAKEGIVGWAIVNADSKDEAIELSKKFWAIAGDGSGTIQRVYDPDENPWQEQPAG